MAAVQTGPVYSRLWHIVGDTTTEKRVMNVSVMMFCGRRRHHTAATAATVPPLDGGRCLAGRGAAGGGAKQCSDCMTSCMPHRPCVPSHPNEMDDCQGRDQPWHRAAAARPPPARRLRRMGWAPRRRRRVRYLRFVSKCST